MQDETQGHSVELESIFSGLNNVQIRLQTI